MKKRILSVLLVLVMLVSYVPLTASALTLDGGIHSIGELNTSNDLLDSHAEETAGSSLELDYRRSYLLSNSNILPNGGDMWYPRVKTLSDGSYILFFQDGRWGPNVYYTRSTDGVNWDTPTILFASHLTTNNRFQRNYATCDAIELANGDIVVAAIFQAVRIEGSSDTPNRYDMTQKGMVTRVSHDKGDTWTEQQIVYQGRCWEPAFLQLPDGTVQMYFTHSGPKDAEYGSLMDDHVSSGVGMLTSTDNGMTWSPMALSYPYVANRIAQQKIYTTADGIDILTDQMPSAILLNDKKTIAMSVESAKADGGFNVSIIRSHDYFKDTLAENEYGPYDRDDNFISGSAPYIALFPSGETVLSFYTGGSDRRHVVYLGNSTASSFYTSQPYYPLIHQDIGMWGDVFTADSHTLVTSATDLILEDASGINLHTNGIGISHMVLNHRINAKTATMNIDANTADWNDNTDALFVGSVSQAQTSIRAAHDSNNIYFLFERLDNKLSTSDSYVFSIKGSDSAIYRVYANTTGVTKLTKTSGGTTTTLTTPTSAKKIIGSVGNDSNTDTGLIIEFAIPKSYFSGDTLSVYMEMTNKDGSVTYTDIFDTTSASNTSTWKKITLSSTYARTNLTSISNGTSTWDGVSADISFYAKNTSATEFSISSGAQLYALSVLCASADKAASVNGDGKVYYDSNYNVIFDKTKVSSAAGSVAGNKLAGKKVYITNDIDLAYHPFLPIGNTGSLQASVFDGGGYTIKNLYVNSSVAQHRTLTTQYFYGLFACNAGTSTVQNLHLQNVVLDIDAPATAKHIHAGGISAYSLQNARFADCSAENVTIIYNPEDGIAPASCKLGGAIGRPDNALKNENLVISNFELQNPKSLTVSLQSNMLWGASNTTPVFKNCKVFELPEEIKDWDGASADISWYVNNINEVYLHITNAEEFYGMAVLCNSADASASVNGDARVYYDSNYKVIFDKSKITSSTSYVAATNLAGKIINLDDNIDLEGLPFTPAGTSAAFSPELFNAQNCTISGLYVNSDVAESKATAGEYYFGLFGKADNAGIKNLIIRDAVLDIDTPADPTTVYAGTIAAFASGRTQITDCKIIGSQINYNSDASLAASSALIGAVIGRYETTREHSNITITSFDVDNPSELEYSMSTSKLLGKITKSSSKEKFTNCSITLKMRAEYGDFDGDGHITNTDITLIIRHLSGWQTDKSMFDITGDGRITNRDAIKAINMLADPMIP